MKMWPSIRSRPPTVQREFRGINKLDAFSIADSYATDMSNLTHKYPAITVRPGFSLLGSALSGKILGLGVWKDTELHAIAADGKWYRWNGAAWDAALLTGLSTTANASFCNFKGNLSDINLIMANGTDFKAYDGSTVTSLATAPAGGNFVEQYADRLYAAVGNDLHFTAYRMANDWTTVNGDDADSGNITIETPNGETLMAVKAGIGHLTLAKPNSLHELYGTSASDYRVIVVTLEIGAINNRCMININGVMYILHRTGIYKYGGGTIPSKQFSQAVQWYVDNMIQAAQGTCCLGTDGTKLYVSLPMGAAATVPDTTLEYDPVFGIWSVWKDWSPISFAKMGADWYFGDSSGKVNKVTGTTDNGTAITWSWVSKPFGSGSLAQKIRWNRLWLVANVPAGSTLNISLSKSDSGDSDWTVVKTVAADSTLESTTVYVPVDVVANANWIRVKFSGTGPCEIKEFSRDEITIPAK